MTNKTWKKEQKYKNFHVDYYQNKQFLKDKSCDILYFSEFPTTNRLFSCAADLKTDQ